NLKGLVTDFADGALQKTGNSLDVALTGDAFLTVQTPQGVRLTRDGSLTMNPQGLLVQANGNGLLLGDNGQPIRIPAQAKAITINERGQISTDGKAVGRLGLAGVSRADQPVKVGDNLFAVRSLRPASATASVRQGYLEGSNVSVVKEMISMIATMRAYETNQKMLQAEDDATGKAVNDVAKV
ncbi:MAG: flagellar hook-basal body protein, partial [Armatimonadota bacterium]|nr:flagellar hook-basal body protein [Armatimonadota bacterium]